MHSSNSKDLAKIYIGQILDPHVYCRSNVDAGTHPWDSKDLAKYTWFDSVHTIVGLMLPPTLHKPATMDIGHIRPATRKTSD